MLDKPQIVRTDAQLTAIIRLTIPRAEIRSVMSPAIAEVMATIAAQGIAPAGPIFSHHLRMDPDTFDFEIGVPVKALVSAAGRVKAGQLPAATVARTVYHGAPSPPAAQSTAHQKILTPFRAEHSPGGRFDFGPRSRPTGEVKVPDTFGERFMGESKALLFRRVRPGKAGRPKTKVPWSRSATSVLCIRPGARRKPGCLVCKEDGELFEERDGRVGRVEFPFS